VINEKAIAMENISVLLEPYMNEIEDILNYEGITGLTNAAYTRLNEVTQEVESQENMENILFVLATVAILSTYYEEGEDDEQFD
jgi:hypothetical protein